mmetsp:Transcript_9018/g.10004  ORF Transcript_9018/g.10004 Transcript_9018/m.10004 type:complete len:255 (-) Transcript_9018:103-867(-)
MLTEHDEEDPNVVLDDGLKLLTLPAFNGYKFLFAPIILFGFLAMILSAVCYVALSPMRLIICLSSWAICFGVGGFFVFRYTFTLTSVVIHNDGNIAFDFVKFRGQNVIEKDTVMLSMDKFNQPVFHIYEKHTLIRWSRTDVFDENLDHLKSIISEDVFLQNRAFFKTKQAPYFIKIILDKIDIKKPDTKEEAIEHLNELKTKVEDIYKTAFDIDVDLEVNDHTQISTGEQVLNNLKRQGDTLKEDDEANTPFLD